MIFAPLLLALAASPVQVEPSALQLGVEPEAAIVLVVPLGCKSVWAVSANGVGALSTPEKIADGRFRARFTFPKERFPQLALLRLELEGEGGVKSRQWIALPLIAIADLKIETKPSATVTVTIGEKTFGPAIADARGRVTIAAKVPPGFPSATLLAVDRAGNRTTRPLDLLPRTWPRAAGVLASGGEATAGQQATIEIFAVEPDGRPLARAEGLRVTAQSGSIEGAIAGEGGLFTAAWRAPASVAVGADLITIGVEGTSATTQLEVKLKAGVPARLVLTLTPPSYLAGSGTAVRLRIEAVDAVGNPLALDQPQFSTDFGRIEASVDGLLLRIPDVFAGRSRATVSATASGVKGEATLALVAAAPSRAELEFPSRVAAGETAAGKLFIADSFGNPVEKVSVTAAVSSGRAAAVAPGAGGGNYELTLATDREDPPGDHEFQVAANGQQVARKPLMVMHYQRRWAIKLGVFGFVQSNLSQWISVGPRIALGLRVGGTGLDLLAEGVFGYYAPIRKAQAVNGGEFDINLQQLSILLGARYWIAFGVRTALHLSLTGGLQNTASRVTRVDGAELTRSQLRLGLTARVGAGVGFQLGLGRVVLQLEYTVAPSDGLVQGNLGGLGLAAGYLAAF